MIFVYLIPNDHVLMYYHYSPYVISYFRCFSIFTHLGWLYKPPYKFVTLTFHFSVHTRSFSFSFSFLSSLSSFSPFLGCQTPSKDDSLEDERLKPLPPLSKRLLGIGSTGCWWLPCFSCSKFSHFGSQIFISRFNAF